MKNLLALVGLIVVGFAGLGWYLGWYNLAVKSTPDGKYNVAGDVDSKKITDDIRNAGKKLGKVLNEETGSTPATGNNFVGPPVPGHMQPKADDSGRGGITIPIEIKLPSPNR